MEASLLGRSIINSIYSLTPSLEDEEWGWKCQASDCGLVTLVLSPHPGDIQSPTQSHLTGTKDASSSLITQEPTSFKSPVLETG